MNKTKSVLKAYADLILILLVISVLIGTLVGPVILAFTHTPWWMLAWLALPIIWTLIGEVLDRAKIGQR